MRLAVWLIASQEPAVRMHLLSRANHPAGTMLVVLISRPGEDAGPCGGIGEPQAMARVAARLASDR